MSVNVSKVTFKKTIEYIRIFITLSSFVWAELCKCKCKQYFGWEGRFGKEAQYPAVNLPQVHSKMKDAAERYLKTEVYYVDAILLYKAHFRCSLALRSSGRKDLQCRKPRCLLPIACYVSATRISAILIMRSII